MKRHTLISPLIEQQVCIAHINMQEYKLSAALSPFAGGQ